VIFTILRQNNDRQLTMPTCMMRQQWPLHGWQHLPTELSCCKTN